LLKAWCRIWSVHRRISVLLALLEHFLAVITTQNNGVCAANGTPDRCGLFVCCTSFACAAKTDRCSATRPLLKAWRCVWSLDRCIPPLLALIKDRLVVVTTQNDSVCAANRTPDFRGDVLCSTEAYRCGATRRLLKAWCRIWSVHRRISVLLALLEHFLAVITAQDNGVCAANGAPQCCAGFPRSIRPSAAAETYRCGATRRLLEAGRSVWSLNRRIPPLLALLE